MTVSTDSVIKQDTSKEVFSKKFIVSCLNFHFAYLLFLKTAIIMITIFCAHISECDKCLSKTWHREIW